MIASSPPHINAGTHLGPYRVESHLGSGGMGDVYRALDTRLGRPVALKVLPPRFADDTERRLRFEREARLVASLNHPNICAIFDIGSAEGSTYLVMELLEGETLSTRLARGPLPLNLALRTAIEIGDALDRAHREGVIHRDLKPSNVILTRSGAKLLDFGLAKIVPPALRSQRSDESPTISGEMASEVGSLLGTLPYMAPEQLEGHPVDARTDIFAFGLVLYQMLTGRRAFSADSNAGLIAAVLMASPPPVSSLQPLSTPGLDRVVRACLEKDPADRWQTAHDLVAELRWQATGTQATGPVKPPPRTRRRWLRAAAIAAAMATAGGAGYLLAKRGWSASTAPDPIRATILLPAGAGRVWPTYPIPPVLSPDGKQLAFVVSTEGAAKLWVRSLDTLDAQPLAGTDGATFPFWSPDGESLAFFAAGTLKRIPARGGSATTLCDAPTPRGGTWNEDGVILFGSSLGGIHRVAASGGGATAVTKIRTDAGEAQHVWPQFLPGGKRFFYVSGTPQLPVEADVNAVYVGSLDGTAPVLLFRARDRGFRTWDRIVRYASGHLLFRPQADLVAQAFDPVTLTAHGDPIPVAENVQTFSVSDRILSYQEGNPEERYQLRWMARDGTVLENLGTPAGLGLGRLSPDGKTAAMERTDPRTGNVDIWLYDITRRAATRFTTSPARDRSPVFSPDGRAIAYDSDRSGHFAIYRRALSGAANDKLMYDSPPGTSDFPGDFSPDGKWLAVTHLSLSPREDWDVWILSLADRKMTPFADGESRQAEPRFSADGRLIAYLSTETGRQELHVVSYPDRDRHVQASTDGAGWLMWRRDGRAIVYRDLRGRFFEVGLTTTAGEIIADAPRPVLEAAIPFARGHDIAPDGSRFLVSSSAETLAPPVTLLLNWRSVLPEVAVTRR